MEIDLKNIVMPMLCILFGCTPDPLPVNNVPDPEETVVVGSINAVDEFLVISLTENFSALEGGTEGEIDDLLASLLIDGLDVNITVDDTSYPLMNEQLGLYVGRGIPEEPGLLYTLNFTNPFNGLPVSATSELLPFVGFDSLSVWRERSASDSVFNIGIRFTDPPGPNWYMVNVQLFDEEFDIREQPYTELLEDQTSTGKTLDLTFQVSLNDYEQGNAIIISMANITHEYYDFLRLRDEAEFELFEGLSEPINYPTNVENGLGFFNMHMKDVRIVMPD